MYDDVVAKWNLNDVPIEKLYEKVEQLEARVKVLEEENVNTTNSLYEIANSIESRIDILLEDSYNLNKFSLDK